MSSVSGALTTRAGSRSKFPRDVWHRVTRDENVVSFSCVFMAIQRARCVLHFGASILATY
jgi:hypothetical protein